MKSIGKDYDNIMEHESNRQLIPPSSPDKSNIVGAPRSNPRIGFEYQVEVPSMIKESKRLKLLMNTVDSELVHNEVEDNVANLNNSWSDADVKSFLLGLFIFGKNFVQIKRFSENKGMGEILSFYYGKFVSKSYSEGRISLEEYITSLKSTVALGVLVEAVGIGKGKEDLTRPTVEHVKKTQVFSIQTSKAWSSLGPSDIIKHLTGGYRLSKAKSNDIFKNWDSQSSCFPDANKKAGNPLSHQQDVTLISSSAEVSVELKKEGKNFNRVCLDKGISCDKVDKYESQHSINFNAPQVPLKFEDGEMMAKAEKDEQGLKPNDTIPRRKSTRNRPLTVRALESFANEFLHAQRKQKRKDILILKDPFNACSRKARTKGLKNVA
ncbi:hypothetical protein glysoja_023794 [Glycine soja]|nr:hypothetical protein glysoja_023794 [Glycine soja]